MNKGKKRIMWIIAAILSVLALLLIAFFVLLAVNQHAALNTIDRVAGGSRNIERVTYAGFGESSAQSIAVYRNPARTESLPVIMFVHGGGWHEGSPDDYSFVARTLAPEGYIVVLPGYRLYPEAKFPSMLEDTADALAWTRANIVKYGGDPDSIYFAGHSAGAYNVAMVALDPQWLDAKGLTRDTIKGVIGMAGPYDFYPFDSDLTVNSFGDAADPQATQPINFVDGNAPPLLLMTGEQDTSVKPRNTRVLAEKVRAAGGRATTAFYDDMSHAQIIKVLAQPFARDRRVIDDIKAFITETQKAATSNPATTSARQSAGQSNNEPGSPAPAQ